MIGKYAAGKYEECPGYITRIQTDEVTISFDEENVVNVDGEALYAKDVNIRLIPGAMKLVVPAGMHFFD